MTTSDETTAAVRGWLSGRLPADWFVEAVDLTIDREEITVVGRLNAPIAPSTPAEPEPAESAPTGGTAGSDDADHAVGVDPAGGDGGPASSAEISAAEAGRIAAFREDTRDARIRIARELEHQTGRKVAWGVQCGGTRQLFTTMSVPVMTRLRQPERRVLDTLVDAGVARSRSDALAWCVKLVGQHSDDWLTDLRTALRSVEEVRGRGPAA